ncbi:uncharacterized protein LOC111088068 isoform X2 [Limulus polyphemus]|uniref:Uncharacterized protein LOC111088068 isoform X2 n=1 Tax=Limulus polyphemus TaxID=6850 RepID=A0ABM1T9T4_LIMPO|nr:uncharacterized protein LOC111088068 isoform X2 [Limulus polyphemus]
MYPTLPSASAQSSLPKDHITIYVLLAGVVGGLILAVAVMVCCKICLRKKKPLTRQHVVFNRGSERQHSRARKYHSLDSSISVDIETSCGFSDNNSSPSKEPKEQYTLEEYHLPVSGCVSPRSLSEQLPEIPETKIPELGSEHKSPVESSLGPAGSRRSSGGGIQRQASLCISDEEDAEATLQRQSIESDQSVLCESLPSNETGESNGSRAHSPGEVEMGAGVTKVSVVVHHHAEHPEAVTSESPTDSTLVPKEEQESSQYSHSHSSLDSSSTKTVIAQEAVGKRIDVKESSSQTIWSSISAVILEEYLEVTDSCQQSSVDSTKLESYDHVSVPSQQTAVESVALEKYECLQVKEDPHIRKRSVSSLDVVLDGEGWKEIPTSLREARSTENGILERKLELYQEENRKKTVPHSNISSPEQESTETYKIRYHDTGSKEDVREETIVISSSESEEMEEEELVKEEYDFERQQYRELWELRAAFEEEELQDISQIDEGDDLTDICHLEVYDTENKTLEVSGVYDKDGEKCISVIETEQIKSPKSQEGELSCQTEGRESQEKDKHVTNGENQDSSAVKEKCKDDSNDLTEGEQLQRATERPPDLDPVILQARLLDSDEDPVYSNARCEPSRENLFKITNNLLHVSSYESRRHSYQNLLARRLERRYASDPIQPTANSTDNSLDSMETEGSSTDISRTEGHTTSMDSTTTDNTDSTGDGQSHMLQQMKADSGYKSMSVDGNGKPPKLSRKQIQPAIDEDTITVLDSILNKDSFCVNGIPEIKEPIKSLESSSGEQVKRKIVSSKEHLLSFNKGSATSGEIDRKKIKSAFKKRRQYLKSRHDPETLSDGDLQWHIDSFSDFQSVSDSRQDVRAKSSVFHRFFQSNRLRFDRFLMRDYSVDEKSDTLFREFARSDPMCEVDYNVSSRFLHGHFRMYHHYSYSRDQNNTSPRMSRKALSPQLSIEEEPFESDEERHSADEDWHCRTESLSRHQPQVAHAAGIPVIRLPMENNY